MGYQDGTGPLKTRIAIKVRGYYEWVISERELTGQLTAAVESDPLIRPDALPACRVMVCRLIPAILRILRDELRNVRPISKE